MIKNNKDTSCARLKYQDQLNYLQVSGSNKYDEDDDASTAAKQTQDALISTSFKNEQMVGKMKAFYLLEGVMVPVLVDPDGYIPNDRWDFDTHYNFLLENIKVSQ